MRAEHHRPHAGWIGAVFGAVALLGGCANPDTTDLQDFVLEVRGGATSEIEPLPEVEEFEIHSYEAHAARDPFRPPAGPDRAQANGSDLAPDDDRERQYLEQYPLDSLIMVGLFAVDGSQWALVRTPDGVIHRVTVGHYIGQNHGRIIDIEAGGMAVRELVPDGMGGWRERDAALALRE